MMTEHKNHLLQGLNPQQLEAVQHIEGPALVLAGAGSGKTRVVTRRIAHLIESGIPSHQIIALTFTNKAANEMKNRVLEISSQPVWVGTFHSFGLRILRETIPLLGYEPSFSIYDASDSEKVIKDLIKEIRPGENAKELKEHISQSKSKALSPEEYKKLIVSEVGEVHAEAIAGFIQAYQETLKRSNAIDFDDLLMLPLTIWDQHPEVLEKHRERFRYLLIDEYQDTNTCQYLLAKRLSGNDCNLFAVGDPDQSIYSWRGANIQNILKFEEDFPSAKIIRLEQNYRSTEKILKTANSLIKHNMNRYDKTLISELGQGEDLMLYSCENDSQEAHFVVDEIRRWRREGVSLNDMVIFYRTNFQSRAFEDVLLEQNLPYQIIGGLSFYDRKEIKDLLAYLTCIVSTKDTLAFERALNTPKRGIGPTSISKIKAYCLANELPILVGARQIAEENSTVKLSKKQTNSLKEFFRIIDEVKELEKEGNLYDIIEKALDLSGLIPFYKQSDEKAQEREENLNELMAKALDWQDHHENEGLSHFLEDITLQTTLDSEWTEEDRLSLMTLHNGKGLEYKVVFLVGLEEDLFPHINSKLEDPDVEEERRLCYVGMTRAKEKLYLSHSNTRYLWGSFRRMRPSRFLYEINDESVEKLNDFASYDYY